MKNHVQSECSFITHQVNPYIIIQTEIDEQRGPHQNTGDNVGVWEE